MRPGPDRIQVFMKVCGYVWPCVIHYTPGQHVARAVKTSARTNVRTYACTLAHTCESAHDNYNTSKNSLMCDLIPQEKRFLTSFV